MSAPSSETRSRSASSSIRTSATPCSTWVTFNGGRLARRIDRSLQTAAQAKPARPEETSQAMSQSFHALRAHARRFEDARNRDHFVTLDDERPRLTLGPRNLRVHEEILNLLGSVREPVARSPAAHLETRKRRRDPPWSPPHLSLQLHRA